MPKQPNLPLPDIVWDGATLTSRAYDDVYASREGGVAETEYVFLGGNGFPERWKTQNHFTIAELGFGAGLNFFTTWRQFITHAAPEAHLHFISTERYPLNAQEMMRAIAPYRELEWMAHQFAARLPQRLAGIHHLQFERVTLTLCYGDAAETLPQLNHRVDAWFLDGFSPAKNPTMWGEEVLKHVARLGGTFATFTAAGEVKRRMEAFGYRVEKRPGFGKKRDMLIGSHPLPMPHHRRDNVTIIGGGIAGCSTAYALARRGHRVTLYEEGIIASGASGNPAALLYPRITKHWSPEMSFYLSAYSYMLSHIPYWNSAHEVAPLIKTIKDEQERERFTDISARTNIDPSILYLDRARDALIFPSAMWIDPRELCYKLLQHPHITVHENAAVDELPASLTVLCNGYSAQRFAPECAMKQNAGQISLVPNCHLQHKPNTPHSHKGYIIPHDAGVLIGATYDREDLSGAVTQANHQKNREEAQTALADLFTDDDMSDWQGRTSLRATTPSRMPYIQKVREGLYINAGHGSRGMLSAPYGAELLANEICNS
ncbi:MAG: tRNA (5-methylaminomethyl-2-thiouridine)(34)-methyltransferase MnmD [Alphaproteobacteria bacterium]|nr:tRNA (5-methylaminomethyl-2-thiouridine)(34)-methyltransferase MnmD [Alphaproteobacteria bacterium]